MRKWTKIDTTTLLSHEYFFFFTGEYPEMSKVFVEERDTFLAYSLKQAALEIPIHDATRPREPRVVVGVVGLGHVAGIVNKFESVTSQEVEQVISKKHTQI